MFPAALVLGLNYTSVTSSLCNLKLHKINVNITEDKNADCSNGMQNCKINVELEPNFIVSFYIFDTQVTLPQCLALRVHKFYQTNYACLARTNKHQEFCLLIIRITTTASETAKSLFNL